MIEEHWCSHPHTPGRQPAVIPECHCRKVVLIGVLRLLASHLKTTYCIFLLHIQCYNVDAHANVAKSNNELSRCKSLWAISSGLRPLWTLSVYYFLFYVGMSLYVRQLRGAAHSHTLQASWIGLFHAGWTQGLQKGPVEDNEGFVSTEIHAKRLKWSPGIKYRTGTEHNKSPLWTPQQGWLYRTMKELNYVFLFAFKCKIQPLNALLII